MNLRAAVIGCGKIGSAFAEEGTSARVGVYTHAGAWAACPGAELVALCDPDRDRLQAAARHWSVDDTFADFRELLAQGCPDLVSVCTPDETHFEVTSAAIQSGSVRGVFLEKPLATNPDDAARLVELAREAGIILAVNYSRRYAVEFQALRDQIAAGRIGTLQAVHGHYTKGLLHNGTHWIDLLRFLAGEIEGLKVLGAGADFDGDPTLSVQFDLASGARAVLQGCDADAFTIFEMDLVGTDGRVRITDGGHRFEWFSVAPSLDYPGYQILEPSPDGPAGGLRDATLEAAKDLAGSLEADRSPICTGRDALEASRWAWKAIHQAASISNQPQP